MSDDELIRTQHERWSDPETQARAQRQANEVKLNRATLAGQAEFMRRAPKVPQRIFWLRTMAATWGAAVAPHAACRDGCSACCHQPVMLTEAEAKLIAAEIGVEARTPARWRDEPALEFSGKPCPFLAGSRCSIYHARPIACRLLFNLDRDDLLCRIVPGSPARVPYADATALNTLYVAAHVDVKRTTAKSRQDMSDELRLADLRDFFPEGQGQ